MRSESRQQGRPMHPVVRGIALASLCLVTAVILAADEKTSFKTYNLQTAASDGTNIIKIVKEAIGQDKQVFYYAPQNQLMVSGTYQDHKLVEMVLHEVNRPQPNIRLDVTFREIGSSSRTGLGVKGSGRVVVTPDQTHSKFKAKYKFHNQSGGMSELNQQTLVVQNGKEASLMVGSQVPFYEWIIAFGEQWDLIPREVALGNIPRERVMENVGSYLVALPRIIGNGSLMTVTLTPEIRGLVGNKRQRIRFAKVSTTVTIRDGQTITIGGSGEAKEFYDKFLVGMDAAGNRRSLDISLTARLMKPDGQPVHP